MAKISARGDTAQVKLRKLDGGLVVLTRQGRLLERAATGNYAVRSAHWAHPGWCDECPADRQARIDYLTEHVYPGATVIR